MTGMTWQLLELADQCANARVRAEQAGLPLPSITLVAAEYDALCFAATDVMVNGIAIYRFPPKEATDDCLEVQE